MINQFAVMRPILYRIGVGTAKMPLSLSPSVSDENAVKSAAELTKSDETILRSLHRWLLPYANNVRMPQPSDTASSQGWKADSLLRFLEDMLANCKHLESASLENRNSPGFLVSHPKGVKLLTTIISELLYIKRMKGIIDSRGESLFTERGVAENDLLGLVRRSFRWDEFRWPRNTMHQTNEFSHVQPFAIPYVDFTSAAVEKRVEKIENEVNDSSDGVQSVDVEPAMDNLTLLAASLHSEYIVQQSSYSLLHNRLFEIMLKSRIRPANSDFSTWLSSAFLEIYLHQPQLGEKFINTTPFGKEDKSSALGDYMKDMVCTHATLVAGLFLSSIKLRLSDPKTLESILLQCIPAGMQRMTCLFLRNATHRETTTAADDNGPINGKTMMETYNLLRKQFAHNVSEREPAFYTLCDPFWGALRVNQCIQLIAEVASGMEGNSTAAQADAKYVLLTFLSTFIPGVEQLLTRLPDTWEVIGSLVEGATKALQGRIANAGKLSCHTPSSSTASIMEVVPSSTDQTTMLIDSFSRQIRFTAQDPNPSIGENIRSVSVTIDTNGAAPSAELFESIRNLYFDCDFHPPHHYSQTIVFLSSTVLPLCVKHITAHWKSQEKNAVLEALQLARCILRPLLGVLGDGLPQDVKLSDTHLWHIATSKDFGPSFIENFLTPLSKLISGQFGDILVEAESLAEFREKGDNQVPLAKSIQAFLKFVASDAILETENLEKLSSDDFLESDSTAEVVNCPWRALVAFSSMRATRLGLLFQMIDKESPLSDALTVSFVGRIRKAEDLYKLADSLPFDSFLDIVRRSASSPAGPRVMSTLLPFLLFYKALAVNPIRSLDEIESIVGILKRVNFDSTKFAATFPSINLTQAGVTELFAINVLHYVVDLIKSGDFFENGLHGVLRRVFVGMADAFYSMAYRPARIDEKFPSQPSQDRDLASEFSKIYEEMVERDDDDSGEITGLQRLTECNGFSDTLNLTEWLYVHPIRAVLIFFSRVLTSPLTFTSEKELGADISTALMTGRALPTDESGLENYSNFWQGTGSDELREFVGAMTSLNIAMPKYMKENIAHSAFGKWWREERSNIFNGCTAEMLNSTIDRLYTISESETPETQQADDAFQQLRQQSLAAIFTNVSCLSVRLDVQSYVKLFSVIHCNEVPPAVMAKFEEAIESADFNFASLPFKLLNRLQSRFPLLCLKVWGKISKAAVRSDESMVCQTFFASSLGPGLNPVVSLALLLRAFSENYIYVDYYFRKRNESAEHQIPSSILTLKSYLRAVVSNQSTETLITIFRILTRSDITTYTFDRLEDTLEDSSLSEDDPEAYWKLTKQRFLTEIMQPYLDDPQLVSPHDRSIFMKFNHFPSIFNFPPDFPSQGISPKHLKRHPHALYPVSHREILDTILVHLSCSNRLENASADDTLCLMNGMITAGIANRSLLATLRTIIQRWGPLSKAAPMNSPSSCFCDSRELSTLIHIVHCMSYLDSSDQVVFETLRRPIQSTILQICAYLETSGHSETVISPVDALALFEVITMKRVEESQQMVYALAILTDKWIRGGIQIPSSLPALLLSCLHTISFSFESGASLLVESADGDSEISVLEPIRSISEWISQSLALFTESQLLIVLDVFVKLKVPNSPSASSTNIETIIMEIQAERRLANLSVDQICSLCVTLTRIRSEDGSQLAAQRIKERALMPIADTLLDISSQPTNDRKIISGKQVTHILSAYARCRVVHRGLFTTLCTKLNASRPLLASVTASDAVHILRALSSVGHIDEELIQKLMSLIIMRGEGRRRALPLTSTAGVNPVPPAVETTVTEKLSHIDCLIALSSIAKLKIHNEDYVRYVSESILSGGFEKEFSFSHIVLIVGSFARMNMTHSVLVQNLMERIVTEDDEECEETLSGSSAATLLLALGNLQYTNGEVWGKLAERIIEDIGAISVRHTEDLCIFIQKMSWRNEKLLRALGDHLSELAEQSQDNSDAPSVPPLVARLVLDTFGMFLINHTRARRALSPVAAAATVVDRST
ncbi:hypothetical protein XU18_2034 [Perkinsela sp. CCAP 1560/4]|nr:hypothetical protein XU18_2034 [Perkinsela sp. CCAP 1560/4]|eukprot:KNH07502.1 hypothetical protein XU18_2034 [Perkinsela sp. CCAP 1560/4]